MDRVQGQKRKRPSFKAKSLKERVRASGGAHGFALDQENSQGRVNRRGRGVFSSNDTASKSNSSRTRQFRDNNRRPSSPQSVRTQSSIQSRFSRASSRTNHQGLSTNQAVHVVCAISENLAQETCVASMDAGSPTVLQVSKQGNGQTYAETLAYLEILKPDEILLNEGRRNSPLVRKVVDLFGSRRIEQNIYADEDLPDDRFGDTIGDQVVVKFVSRSLFDQTRGGQLIQSIAREDSYDATFLSEYILLASSHAVLHYLQQSLGAYFSKKSVFLDINAGGKNRMEIDRATMLQLELLVNNKTGKTKDSLVSTIDCTKTSIGSRLLRANLLSPPLQAETINARLDLVDLFLGSEEFFYIVYEHLNALPGIDRMLSNIALIPTKNANQETNVLANERMASKGISALVCMKSVLQALPSLATELQNFLNHVERNDPSVANDVATIVTNQASLHLGLGTGTVTKRNRNHLIRAIIFALTQPPLSAVLEAVSDIFDESVVFSRNKNEMRHQECFAFKCDEHEMMAVIRKAFLANIDNIYRKADEYAEVFGFSCQVRFTATRGYFLAVPLDVGESLPDIFLQPCKSGRSINCTTDEVSSLSSRAQDNVQDLLLMTHDRIQEVMAVAREHYDSLASLSDAIALLDLCHSFADHVSSQSGRQWCRPKVTDFGGKKSEDFTASRDGCSDSLTLESVKDTLVIREGRFPIELSDASGFEDDDGPPGHLPNDAYSSTDKPFTVITGINGSGKSTYLRQIALIAVLAHCGSYVPAKEAIIPMRDRLCCRIGNADDQEHNISTFLLEMKETAFICNHATSRSLVLVDELGRATSNEDGVAMAWATAEFLLQKQAMTFFVTHYPQISSLSSIYPGVQNVHLEASVSQNSDQGIQYTHKVKPGACKVSTDYGVELAAACGWPPEVVDDARAIQEDVKNRLPSESFCQHENADPIADNSETLALQALDDVCTELQGLFQDETVQSYEALRSRLSKISNQYLNDNQGLIELISPITYPMDSSYYDGKSIEHVDSTTGNPKVQECKGDGHERSSSHEDSESQSDLSDDCSDQQSWMESGATNHE